MKNYFFIAVLIFLNSTIVHSQLSADQIIDKTIEKAGGPVFDHTTIHFTFRKKEYRSYRHNGNYRLERITIDAEGKIHDVLSNTGLQRSVNDCPVKVADTLVTRISDGINSVHYFANLPYGLNAPAVKMELIGESTVKGEPFYKIKITFNKEGGGTDYEDEFLYWIHKDNYTIDYFAYKYAVNGGGIRFREAYNPRTIQKLRFVDYNNYKADDLTIPLNNLDILFEKGRLRLLSKIELEDIYVYPDQDCC